MAKSRLDDDTRKAKHAAAQAAHKRRNLAKIRKRDRDYRRNRRGLPVSDEEGNMQGSLGDDSNEDNLGPSVVSNSLPDRAPRRKHRAQPRTDRDDKNFVQGSSGDGSNEHQVEPSAVAESLLNQSSHRTAERKLFELFFFAESPSQQSTMSLWGEQSCFVPTKNPGEEVTVETPPTSFEPRPESLNVSKPMSTGTSFEATHSSVSTDARLPGTPLGEEAGVKSLNIFEETRSSLGYEIAVDSSTSPVKQIDVAGVFEGDLTPLSSPNNSPRLGSPIPASGALPLFLPSMSPSPPVEDSSLPDWSVAETLGSDDGNNNLTEPIPPAFSDILSSPTPAPASLATSRLPRQRPFIIPPPRLEKIDLLSNVIGRQVHQDAQTVTWGCGWKTTLPTKIESGVNVLHAESQRVQWMADSRNSVPADQSRVRYLDRTAYRRLSELVDDVNELNAHNYVVVIPGVTSGDGLNAETFADLREFGMSVGPDMKLSFIDTVKKAKMEDIIHFDKTVPEFFEMINNPDQVGMILDFPVSPQPLPSPFNEVCDSDNSWGHMKSNRGVKAVGLNVPFNLNNALAKTWGLLHLAGTLTVPHQDVAGYSVAGQVLGDRNDPRPKIWGIFSFKDSSVYEQKPEIIAQCLHEVFGYGNIPDADNPLRKVWHDDKQWKDCQVELIYLLPGDLFFQPPGREHIVFTPAASVATGSHYYNYHTLHLTEWTRRIQHFQFVTNQVMSGVKELLNVMMLDFVNQTGKQFYTRSIAALCRMVLDDAPYIQKSMRAKRGNELDRRAIIAAEIVAEVCLNAPEGDHLIYLESLLTGAHYADPGPEFTLTQEAYDRVEDALMAKK